MVWESAGKKFHCGTEFRQKICHLTSVHPAFDVRIFHKECKSLAQAGYEVTLIVPHTRDEKVGCIQIKAVPKPAGRVARMFFTTRQMYQQALQLDADVYHFHDPELIPIGLLFRIKGRKVVYDIHENVPYAILSKYYLPIWLRSPLARLAERVEELTCRWFSALVPATPAIADRFALLNRNTVVVQNFPRQEELAAPAETSWDQRTCSVAYIGGISRERGIREIVEAMSLLPYEINATLKLAGEFSPIRVRDEVMRLPGWMWVEELGFLDRLSVARVLSEAKAGLVLFHPEPNHVTAQPNKLFEYMSAGIPVIASDFPLWRTIIEEAGSGLLVDPLNPKAIAQAIEYLLTHPQEAQAMGRCGLEAVKGRYNWMVEERKLLALYADMLHDG